MIYNRNLRLDILPTEECNFRCVYCYENFKIKKMDDKVIEGIKNLILARSKTLKNLEINWFGGEPMLAYDVIKDIMEYSKYLSIRYNFKLTSSMTTNGSLLTIKKFKELYELYVRWFQISFDGDKDNHNKFRITREKTDTFDIIYNNILNLHKSNINSGKIYGFNSSLNGIVQPFSGVIIGFIISFYLLKIGIDFMVILLFINFFILLFILKDMKNASI